MIGRGEKMKKFVSVLVGTIVGDMIWEFVIKPKMKK